MASRPEGDFSEKEVKEVLRLLEEAGWQPMVCDTAVPYFDCGVPAGIPQMVGDYEGDCIMLPKGLTTYEPIVVIKVRGESMCGAGIENGDMVTLQLDSNVEDGSMQPNFKQIRMRQGFNVDSYALEVVNEIRQALKGLIESE